ncbi:plectin-like [Takifugu rubripes]|uniref:plectin-like n=1 Tax=Takifugu rubripes TaxID=31033 RepID=UPI001145222A|nr:plectin-like [Takifugu rubripes]
MVDEKRDKPKEDICFEGLRALVPAKSLLDSKIIDAATFDKLQKGEKTPQDVSEADKVRRYLQGTDRVDGIIMTDSNEKISIYQAMKDQILQQNTGLALLQVQAGTGSIADPVKNLKYSVDDAVKNGVVGPELHEKLLSAEKAVTGYKDPYTGNKISLFQAMDKDLVLSKHATPLLEAQFSTGGIIDPINSHRVPNDVAIQRGIFSKQLSQAFCDPTDDIKSFINPNTNERVTYQQLVEEMCKRCTHWFMLSRATSS